MRLTDALRNTIRKRMLDHRFGDEAKKLDGEFHTLATDVYNDVFTEAERRKMRNLPKGWMEECDSFQVQFGSTFTELRFRSPKRLPADASGYRRAVKVYPATHALSKRYEELTRKKRDLENADKEARRQIGAALASVGTLKRLHEVWPESKQFTADINPAKPNLPAVPTATLNKLLNIAA